MLPKRWNILLRMKQEGREFKFQASLGFLKLSREKGRGDIPKYSTLITRCFVGSLF